MKAMNNQKMGGTTFPILTIAALVLVAVAGRALAQAPAPPAQDKIFAQVLVEQTVAKHGELADLELATSPPDGRPCITIAATNAKELNDACEKELAVMQTGKPHVEKEGGGYDVTLPLHVSGESIGIIGMDFKPRPGQEEASLAARGREIAKELESQIPSKSKLFEPAK